MNRSLIGRPLATAILLGSILAAPVFAAPLSEHTSGAVRYVTGGIGDDEDAAIKSMMHDYTVSMTFAEGMGGKPVYLSDVPVSIRDDKGAALLNIKTGGPYLLVKLPAGSYTAEASHGGQTQTRKFTVASQQSTQSVVFEWR